MPNHDITAPDIGAFLDGLPNGIKTLSLDCFDTIVWRRVALPTDVFFHLQQGERWRVAGVTASLRAKAEQDARRLAQLTHGRNEVSIEAIYQQLLPQADSVEIAAWVNDELIAEAMHGFVFEPVRQLIRQAHARKLRVIVVSDTYLGRLQLRGLLQTLLGDDARLIAQVYCSSEHGVSKAGGLFRPVLQLEKIQPRQLAHLGDNPGADLHAPLRLGIHARHLCHHTPAVEAQLEQRVSAALQLMPELRHRQGVPSLSHGVLAAHPAHDSVAQRIGYTALGPVFTAFSAFLAQSLQTLRAQGRTVRVAFLLRDGHLPALAYETWTGDAGAARLQISRFTANAASLRSQEDVMRLLAASLSEKSMDALARQLLLPPEMAQRVLSRARANDRPIEAFTRQVLQADCLRTILEQSAAFRQRLLAHVRERTGLQRGETLVLVDLGYSGTVQTRLTDLFREEMDVTLHGLYLIAARAKPGQTDRQGLIGPHWADERLVHALTAYIGLFEMMCTKAEPSTVDYTEAGDPVFGKAGTKGQQNELAGHIQSACLRYIADWRDTPTGGLPPAGLQEQAWQAAAELARLIYFPAADEIDCLSAFEFDFNLGTDLVLATADVQAGQREFRREGFALMNRDFSSMRVSYPMELRHMDVSLATTLLSAQRFGYGITPSRASYRQLDMPALVANASGHSLGTAQAVATHDGFYSLHLPMSASFDMSVLWGQCFEWLQIESVDKVSMSDSSDAVAMTIGRDVILDGMEAHPGGLQRCSEAAMLYLPACGPADHGRRMVRVIFRPLAERAPVQPVPVEDAVAVSCADPVMS